MKKVNGVWTTKRKEMVIMEINFLDLPNEQFLMSYNQAEELLFSMEGVLKRIRKSSQSVQKVQEDSDGR